MFFFTFANCWTTRGYPFIMEILSHKTTSLSMSPEYTLRSIHSQHRSLRVLERDHRSVTWCCGGPLETVGFFFNGRGNLRSKRPGEVTKPLSHHFPSVSRENQWNMSGKPGGEVLSDLGPSGISPAKVVKGRLFGSCLPQRNKIFCTSGYKYGSSSSSSSFSSSPSSPSPSSPWPSSPSLLSLSPSPSRWSPAPSPSLSAKFHRHHDEDPYVYQPLSIVSGALFLFISIISSKFFQVSFKTGMSNSAWVWLWWWGILGQLFDAPKALLEYCRAVGGPMGERKWFGAWPWIWSWDRHAIFG